MKKFKEFLPYVVIIVVVLVVRLFLFSPITVDGVSMEPTLYNGDYMFLTKFSYYFNVPKRFDIVVVNTGEDRVIKRIIGLPGEKVAYVDNKLYINDELVAEPFTRRDMSDFSLEELGVETIGVDKYLVLGDNRPLSLDSRSFGLVTRKQIEGKAGFVLFPFNHFGGKN